MAEILLMNDNGYSEANLDRLTFFDWLEM